MDQRSTFLIRILEKIGAPLMAALQDDAGAPLKDAERMAELIARSVEVGVAMGDAMGLRDSEGQADSTRLALTALAGPLVAGQYKALGRVPGKEEAARITKALQTVLAFSDNFTPSADYIRKLAALDPRLENFSEDQAVLAHIHAMMPALEAVAEFSFGQSETKLIQDVSDKLLQRAGSLRDTLIGTDPDPGAARYQEMSLIGALALLYAACHRAETQKGMAEGAGQPSLDAVWMNFDTRLSMLEALAQSIVPGSSGRAGASGGRAPDGPRAAPVAQEPTKTGSPMGFFKPGGGQGGASASSPPAGGNPMAFFKPPGGNPGGGV